MIIVIASIFISIFSLLKSASIADDYMLGDKQYK